jgi:hypothetical protein
MHGEFDVSGANDEEKLSFGQRAQRRAFRAARCLDIARITIFQPDAVAGMSVAAASVLALGVFEAALLTRRGVPGRTNFCFRYGVSQLLPSIIWYTKPAGLLAKRLGSNPRLLRDLEHTSSGVAVKDMRRAHDSLRVQTAQILRSIIAGFVGISQILRVMSICSDSVDQYGDNVLAGTEPLSSGVNERIIRLGGKESDVTAISMQKYGLHIVPIFEDPHSVEDLIKKSSHNGVTPVFWHVPNGHYSLTSTGSNNKWNGFQIDASWFIPIKNKNEHVLIVEADSSVGEQALALGVEIENDLTLSEMGQAFVSLQKLAEIAAIKDNIKSPRIVRVLLADPNISVKSGGGSSTNYRNYVTKMKEVDIFIDTKGPLLMAIECWAENALVEPQWKYKGKPRGTIVFDTGNAIYYKTMKKLLESRGWKIVDSMSENVLPKDTLYLVYEDSTANTVHKVRKLIQSDIVRTPSLCCALLDKHEGMNQLRALSIDLSKEASPAPSMASECMILPFICSSEIYDGLFKRVRTMIREGKSNGDIQAVLDADINSEK